jgi:hypothetical protein
MDMSEYVFIFSVGVLLGTLVYFLGYWQGVKTIKRRDKEKPFDASALYADSHKIPFPLEMAALKDCPNLNVLGQVIPIEEWDTWRTQDSTEPGE